MKDEFILRRLQTFYLKKDMREAGGNFNIVFSKKVARVRWITAQMGDHSHPYLLDNVKNNQIIMFNTFLSTGFGLTSPSTYEGQLFFIFYAIIGIPLNILYLNTALQKIVSILSDVVRSGYKYMPKNKFLTPPGAKELPLGEILIVSFVIYFCVTLIIAIFFAWIEGWTFFQAVYFLVVACSTVGFGDYVPSKLKTGAEHNIHEGYRVSNWFMIGVGLLLMYVVLNLLANLFKNILGKCIDLCHVRACSCLKSQVEPYDSQKTGVSAQPSTRRTVSRISVANDLDGADLGSFAAIQLALDRLKMEASADDQGSNTELKALSSIEKILQAEYFKVKSRKKSNSVRSRWRRAAQKARQLSPNKETGLSHEDINGPIRAALSMENEKYENLPGVVQ